MKTTDLIQEIAGAIIAVLTVLGALALSGYEVVHGQPVVVPEWVTLLIGAIVGAYFTRQASVNGARQAGTAAAQTALAAAKEATNVASTAQPV